MRSGPFIERRRSSREECNEPPSSPRAAVEGGVERGHGGKARVLAAGEGLPARLRLAQRPRQDVREQLRVRLLRGKARKQRREPELRAGDADGGRTLRAFAPAE